MKKIILEFCRRGMVACGFGPLVLAVVYLVLQNQTDLQTLEVGEVCVGIVSLTVLAFVVGGMNVVYQIERLPLMIAVLIHGVVLYVCYLATYLVNGWLESGVTPLLVFSAIFVFGYLVIWLVIHSVVKRNTNRLNRALKEKQNQA
ncbi:MAG: DUF3021 domain-containing protein [Clostridia bacterium]|nr:DUF3021 domain-containing protein [Clostridia bacterium]